MHGKGDKAMKTLFLGLVISLFFITTANAASITFAWDASDGATGYNLYQGSTSRNYSKKIDTGNVLTYTVTNLTDGTYYFTATAYDKTLESDYSEELCIQIRNSWIPSIRSCTLKAPSFRIKEGTIVFTPKE